MMVDLHIEARLASPRFRFRLFLETLANEMRAMLQGESTGRQRVRIRTDSAEVANIYRSDHV
jgi:hypothetical protein